MCKARERKQAPEKRTGEAEIHAITKEGGILKL